VFSSEGCGWLELEAAKRKEAISITCDGNEVGCTSILHTNFEMAATFLTIWLAEVKFSMQ